MLYDFFPDAGETGFFGKDRNVAVHFAVYFDAFDYSVFVCFQTAVEIMQFDAGEFACRGVE